MSRTAQGFHSVSLSPVISTYTIGIVRMILVLIKTSIIRTTIGIMMIMMPLMMCMVTACQTELGMLQVFSNPMNQVKPHPKPNAAHETSVKSQVPALILSCAVGVGFHWNLGTRVQLEFRVSCFIGV